MTCYNYVFIILKQDFHVKHSQNNEKILIVIFRKKFHMVFKKTIDSLCGKTGSMHGFQRVKEKNRPWFMQKNRVIDGFMHKNRPGFVQKNWLGSRFLCINRVGPRFFCTNHTGFMQKNRTWFSCIVHTRTMLHINP